MLPDRKIRKVIRSAADYLPQVRWISKSQPAAMNSRLQALVKNIGRYFPRFLASRRLNTASAELSPGCDSFIAGVEGEFVLGATTLLPVC